MVWVRFEHLLRNRLQQRTYEKASQPSKPACNAGEIERKCLITTLLSQKVLLVPQTSK